MQSKKITETKTKQGCAAEGAVEKHLSGIGWRLLEKNYRRKCGEIDLIFLDGCEVVFVEVRATRASPQRSLVQYSLGFKKRHRLMRTIELYQMKSLRKSCASVRFDVVWVFEGAENSSLEHWRNVEIG